MRTRTRLATVVIACFMSLGLVVFTPTNANALSGVPPVTIGTTLAAPGSLAGTGTATAACIASLACAALVSGALLVGGLYLTRDSWLPVLEDAWDYAAKRFFGGQTGCAVSLDPQIVTSGQLTLNYSWTACGPAAGQPGSSGQDLAVTQRLICKTGSTYAIQSVSGTTAVSSTSGPGGSSSGIMTTFCPSPGEVVYWRGHIAIRRGSGNAGLSPVTSIGKDIPSDQISTTTTVVCRLPSGSNSLATLATTGDLGKIGLPSCEAQYPGSTPVSVTVTRGPTGAQEQIYTNTLTNPRDLYPDCFGPGGEYLNTCRVQVWINGVVCVPGMTGCNDPAEYIQDHPAMEWDCKWGPYTIVKSNCDPLKNHYTVGAPGTPVTLDPNGNPITDPTTEPEVRPVTPDWVNPQLKDLCLVNCVRPEVPAEPEVPTETQENCMGGFYSMNPVNWVLVPVKCALMWAFVPKNAPSFSDIPSPIPAGWVPTFPSLGDGSCGPIGLGAVDFPLIGSKGPYTLVDTCEAPGPAIRAVTYYGLLAVMLVGLGNRTYSAVTRSVGMGVEGGDD